MPCFRIRGPFRNSLVVPLLQHPCRSFLSCLKEPHGRALKVDRGIRMLRLSFQLFWIAVAQRRVQPLPIVVLLDESFDVRKQNVPKSWYGWRRFLPALRSCRNSCKWRCHTDSPPCGVWIHVSSGVLVLPWVQLGPVDLATCTEAVDAPLVLARAPHCCRSSLAARPPIRRNSFG